MLVGDININTSNEDDNVVLQYENMLNSVGCSNLINIPTHFWATGRSTLDHVISNIDNSLIDAGVLNNGKPGHLPTFAIIRNHKMNSSPGIVKNENEKWRFIDDRHQEKFLEILKDKLLLINLKEHPEKILEAVTIATQSSIDSCFPLKTKSNRAKKRSSTPWKTTKIFKDEKTQSRLFRRFIKTKNPEDHKIYNAFCKKLSKKKYRAPFF